MRMGGGRGRPDRGGTRDLIVKRSAHRYSVCVARDRDGIALRPGPVVCVLGESGDLEMRLLGPQTNGPRENPGPVHLLAYDGCIAIGGERHRAITAV